MSNYRHWQNSPEQEWWEKVRAMIATTDGRDITEISDQEIISYLADALEWEKLFFDN